MSAKQRTAYRRRAPETPLGIPAPGPKVNNVPIGRSLWQPGLLA